MSEEIWKDIEGYEGLYQVSNMGRVRSLDHTILSRNRFGESHFTYRGRILKLGYNLSGYKRAVLAVRNSHKHVQVHRLVAEAFIPNPENKETVNHIDGNKENNCVNNLEWTTIRENINHAVKTGLHSHKGIKVICVETGKVFNTITSAAEWCGTTRDSIKYVCEGKSKSGISNGYHWRYV